MTGQLMIGKTLSRYKIVAKLGEGGMGEVYLAEDTELGREVALKILPAMAEENPERLERFRREARAVASLNHPNIVTLFNVEEAEGRRLLVMERVEGKSLDRALPPSGMPLAEVFAYAIPIADALAAAHEKGITHRDLKPANVMITHDGNVKVLDFGLAKLATEVGSTPLLEMATEAPTESAALTGEGTVMGTAPYMSPEQLKGVEVDSRADIFSFGILLYEMVTGKRPFQGDSGIELASSILKDTPPPVVEARADLPRHLARIIQHCLEKDPERRYQSAKDVRNELQGLRSEVDSGQLSTTGMTAQFPSAGVSQPVTAPGTAASASAASGSVAQEAIAGARQSSVSGPASAVSSPALIGSGPVSEVTGPQSVANRSWGLIAAIVMALLAGVLGVLWWQGRQSPAPAASTAAAPEVVAPTPAASGGLRSVAVLPFANLGGDAELDYLRLAVPDEIVTALSRGSGLAIRPFSTTSRLDVVTTDPLTLGQDLGVANVVAGQYLREGNQLRLTLEAIDVEGQSVVWRDSVLAGVEDLLTLRQAVSDTVLSGLMPTLDPGATAASAGTLPTSEEAYDHYLRSLAMSSDPAPNSEALALIQRSVELDPNFAPAWGELARRLHFLAMYGGGTSADVDRGIEAAQRALELDPELVEPQVRIIMTAIERGDLARAYQAANRLIEQFPRSGRVFFLRAYVLRYAGAIEQSVRDCDTALGLDPSNPSIRSCGITNYLAGRYDRAEQFLNLSPDNDFYYGNLAVVRMRQGQPEEALELGRQTSYTILAAALEPFLAGTTMEPEVLQREIGFTDALNDVEQVHWNAGIFAYVGEHEVALDVLRRAIDGGYCSYPHMDTDPLFASLRGDSESAQGWTEARAAGKACHERFLRETGSG
jgi:serine/threonine protein kinase/TolB-like protein/tetratricopeptide (TPR) repeat protein